MTAAVSLLLMWHFQAYMIANEAQLPCSFGPDISKKMQLRMAGHSTNAPYSAILRSTWQNHIPQHSSCIAAQCLWWCLGPAHLESNFEQLQLLIESPHRLESICGQLAWVQVQHGCWDLVASLESFDLPNKRNQTIFMTGRWSAWCDCQRSQG